MEEHVGIVAYTISKKGGEEEYRALIRSSRVIAINPPSGNLVIPKRRRSVGRRFSAISTDWSAYKK